MCKAVDEIFDYDGDDRERVIEEMATEEIDRNWEAEMINLNINVEFPIGMKGSLELWDGSHPGHADFPTVNIAEAMQDAVCSFDDPGRIEFYVKDGDLWLEQTGHDNPCRPSMLQFYQKNPDTGEEFSIAAPICRLYGWEMPDEIFARR